MQIYAMTLLYSPCSLAERQDVCFLKEAGEERTGITLNSTLMVINELLMEKSLITHIIFRLIFSVRVRGKTVRPIRSARQLVCLHCSGQCSGGSNLLQLVITKISQSAKCFPHH